MKQLTLNFDEYLQEMADSRNEGTEEALATMCEFLNRNDGDVLKMKYSHLHVPCQRVVDLANARVQLAEDGVREELEEVKEKSYNSGLAMAFAHISKMINSKLDASVSFKIEEYPYGIAKMLEEVMETVEKYKLMGVWDATKDERVVRDDEQNDRGQRCTGDYGSVPLLDSLSTS